MILLTSNENFSASSGILNIPFLENIYHSVIDETFLTLGRIVTLHLPPLVQQDNTTQSQPAPQQYNPFFGRVPVPLTNTRNTGTKITHRDVEYRCHAIQGPIIKGEDSSGIGNLKANQIKITLVKEALGHVNEALNFTFEGRRYTIDESRIIGFSVPRYIIILGTEINEQNIPDDNGAING